MFSDQALTLAILAFFSTTVDDFAVVLIFMAREYVKTNDFYNPETQLAFINITLGQLIGFTIIVGVSLAIGVGLGAVVDEQYLALIGFLPILIGLYKIYELGEEAGYFPPCHCCPSWCCCCTPPPEEEEDKGSSSDKADSDGEKGDGAAPLAAKAKEAGAAAAGGGAGAVEETGKLIKKAGAAVDEESKALLDGEEGRALAAAKAAAGGASDGSSSGSDSRRISEPTPMDDDQRTKKFRRKSSIGSLFSNPSRKNTIRGSLASRGDEEDGVGGDEGGAKGSKGDKDMQAVLNDDALDQIESVDQDNCCVKFLKNYFFCCFSPLTMEVGLYSLLFGTDNIAIYVALFSIISVEDLVTVVVIFYAALFIYIGIAILIIVQCPPVGRCIGDYAKYLVPLLLIGLGLYIVHDSVAWVIPDP